MTFVSVNPQGLDTYDVKLANGSINWSIGMAADGKVTPSGFRVTAP